jgi:hypothetical protein
MSYCFDKGIPHSKLLEWDPEDRAKVIAFSLERALRCDMCGTAQWEWDENKFAYTATEEFCQGCYQKTVHQETDSKSLPGTNIRLVPTTPELQARIALTARKRAKMLRDSEE